MYIFDLMHYFRGLGGDLRVVCRVGVVLCGLGGGGGGEVCFFMWPKVVINTLERVAEFTFCRIQARTVDTTEYRASF